MKKAKVAVGSAGTRTYMITTQKDHMLDNNSYEFHVFWVVIMPKTLN